MNIVTNTLNGQLLDFAVALTLGARYELRDGIIDICLSSVPVDIPLRNYSPSTFWEQCGPLLSHGKYELLFRLDSTGEGPGVWLCGACSGATPTIAIARRYVYENFGYSVDIPDEVVLACQTDANHQ